MDMDRILVRAARLVPVGGRPAPADPVDVRLAGGRVVEVGPALSRYAVEPVVEAGGRWVIPGLWDKHTHPVMWALGRRRIDLVGVSGPEETVSRVADHLRGIPAGSSLVLGYGYRSGTWAAQPTVAALDAVTSERPVALVSGDGHNGWLNSAALRLVGLPRREGALAEEEWYPTYPRLEAHDRDSLDPREALAEALREAHAKGVVGIVDFEFGGSFATWPDRVAAGLDTMRVRASTYLDGLDEVGRLGLRTGDRLVPGSDLVTMGPLKVISDGSLNTLTAWCCQAYAGPEPLDAPHGLPNLSPQELVSAMGRARSLRLEAAIHAIGDEAIGRAMDAFDSTGQRGSIEHVQLVAFADLERMARRGIVASVQPAHVLDDREVSELWWGDRTDRLYAFRAMLTAGVTLALGSDAPVSPLDPWLAMAAAVHRAPAGAEAWHPEQSLTAAEALAASTDGQGTVGVGSRGDLVLTDADPLATVDDPAAHAAYLREMPVAATLVAGRVVWGDC